MKDSVVTLSEITDLKKLNHSDGSEGEIPGSDLTFQFDGRRWSYCCAYDRYILSELLSDGIKLQVWEDKTGQIIQASCHFDCFFPPAPPASAMTPHGLSWAPKPGEGKFGEWSRPADPAAERLFRAKGLLDDLSRPRSLPQWSDDRTPYHKEIDG